MDIEALNALKDDVFYSAGDLKVWPERRLERWRSEGSGPPFVRVGRDVAYLGSAVRSWVKSQEVTR